MSRRDLLPAALLTIAVLATGMAWAPHELGRRVFDVLVFVLGLVLALAEGLRRADFRLPRWWPLAFLPAAYGALQMAAGVSVYPFSTWISSLHWAALAAFLILATVATRHPRTREHLPAALGVFAAVAVPVCLLQFFTSRGLVFWLFPSGYDAALGPFVNRNTFANFCEAALPAVVWLGVRRPSIRPLTMTAAGLLLAAPVATGARAGTVLMAAEAVTLAILLRHRLRPAFLIAAIGAAVLVFVAAAGWQPLIERLRDPDPWAYRREAMESAVSMVRERPLMGFGLGTFRYAYPAYAVVDYGVVLNHAHNDWLEFAVEGGLPFAVLLLAAAGFAVRLGVRHPWGIGLPFVFLHGLVDFPLQVDAVLVWILLLVGAAVRENPSERTTSEADMSFVGVSESSGANGLILKTR